MRDGLDRPLLRRRMLIGGMLLASALGLIIMSRSATGFAARAADGPSGLTPTIQTPGRSKAARSAPRLGGGPPGGKVWSLAIARTAPGALFASFWEGGIFKSTNGGDSWVEVDAGIPNTLCELTVDPANAAVAYASCLDEIYRTTDAGQSWVRVGPRLDHPTLPQVAPSDSTVLYLQAGAGASRGLYVSRDRGESWRAVAGPRSSEIGGLLGIDPVRASVLYANSRGGHGVFRSRDGGRSWIAVTNGLPGGDGVCSLAIDPSDANTMYAGTVSHGLFKTTSGGEHWEPVGEGVLGERVCRVAVGGRSEGHAVVYAGDPPFRSDDAGARWTAIGTWAW